MSKRLLKDRRGVSTVIGAVFFVLILLGGLTMISWEMNQYDNYTQVVNDRSRLEWEKQSEEIEIVSVFVDGYALNISVKSEGAVTAHLVDLWITEYTDTTANWHRLFQIDYYVNPGDTVTEIGQDLDTPELDPDLNYEVKIVTERGNIATATYEAGVEEGTPPVHAFGVFSLDWFYFRYTSRTYPQPRAAGSVDKQDDYVAFYLKVVNNYNKNITLLSPSLLMLLVEWQEPHLNLVQNVSYGSGVVWETDWEYTTGEHHTGSYSIRADSGSHYLKSGDLNASGATDITISFWYQDDGIDSGDDVYLQFWNGASYDNIFNLGNGPEEMWNYYTITVSDPEYLVSDFHMRIDATGLDSGWGWREYLWIDDVLITKFAGEEVILLSDGFEDYSSPPVITAYDDANPITVGPRKSETLIFAAENAGSDTWAWEDEMPYYQSGTEGAIVMTALVFTMEGDPDQVYAQSLPFQALVLTD